MVYSRDMQFDTHCIKVFFPAGLPNTASDKVDAWNMLWEMSWCAEFRLIALHCTYI